MAAGPQGWQIDDWRGAGGARPVKTFIDNLSKPAEAKVIAVLQMLEEHGSRLQLPHSLLHAFVKRTEAIRQSDLDVARTRKPAG
jgi:hypothetical protein